MQARTGSPKSSDGGWVSSVLVTLATLATIQLLSGNFGEFVSAGPLYLLAVAYSALKGGMPAGLFSTLLALLHATFFFSVPRQLLSYAETVPLHARVLALAALLLVVLIADFRRRTRQLSEANAVLHRELAEHARAEQAARALAAMEAVLVEDLNFRRTCDRVVTTGLDLFRAIRVVVYEIDAESNSMTCIAAGQGDRARWIGRTLPPGAGVAGRAVAERGLVRVADVLDPALQWPEWLVERYRAEGIRCAAGVPLMVRGEMIGALTLGFAAAGLVSEGELRLLSIFANQAAIALDNARLHRALQASLDELSASQRQVVQAERLQAIEELAAGVAHHLNNRLMVVLGGVQLLLSKVKDTETRTLLEVVERASLVGRDLVQNLVRFTQARTPARVVPVDLNQTVREALDLNRIHQMEAQLRGVNIDTRPDLAPIPAVAGDPILLEEALASLIHNAIEALPAGGCITVRTWGAEGRIYCSVADTGTGMAGETLQRAPQPFFTTKGPQRAGLGLSTAYGIIHRHRGEISIESTEGRGTVITLALPRFD